MNEFMTVKEASKKWGITARRVQVLCSEGRIKGAIKYSSVWAIPRSAEKPNPEKAGRKSKEFDNEENNNDNWRKH